MIELGNIKLGERVHESKNSIIYKGVRADDTPVVVKLPPEEFPTRDRIARMQREYEMTATCAGDGVVRAYGMERSGARIVMVLEDFGGQSVDRVLEDEEWRIELHELLQVAIRAATALSQIHSKHIMHKDITPANILWNRDSGEVKIIDFGISTELSRENPSAVSPAVMEGTLAFMSPEQTGRMNRAIDYRTDLYSLGATLYLMFAGSLPFDADDPMSLVHSHIAQVPQPVHKVNRAVPVTISRIVAKLMAKNAEDRYQSAVAVRRDLERCATEWREHGRISDFELARGDVSERFQIPQKLYGRDRQIEQLLAAFSRVADGGCEMVLVAGYSGIGKSALVHEVHKPIVEKRGYFISGKFDQFNRNIPYASLIQAFQALVQQLLTESDDALEAWRTRLNAVLGVNGGVIVDVIPDVELIIGEQPPVVELPPAEAQNRFNMVFESFVRTFAAAEHPLTVFLDDLQWADGPSLNLIKHFMTDSLTSHIFLIGAYRDNEVSPTHPLMLTLQEMVEDRAEISTITLGPLADEHVDQLIRETLHRPVDEVRPLTEICQSKTGGNPFFLCQFLRAVYEDGGIDLDQEARRWVWHDERIAAMEITENVVDLMARKIRKLPDTSQNVLRLASCIGAAFDLYTLSIVNEKNALDTAEALWPGIAAGLILPVTADYKFLQEDDRDELGSPSRIVYRWLHDRVQQAAYSLIGDEKRKAVHGRVGRLMLEKLSADQREEKLFEIVNHLNMAADRLSKQSERDELARLNLAVGKRAVASAAYEPAWRFLNQGLTMLGDGGWERDYQLALELTSEAAEAGYLSGEFERMDELVDTVLANAKDVLDEIRVHDIRIQANIARNRHKEAIQGGIDVLEKLGVSLPRNPKQRNIVMGVLTVKVAVGRRKPAELADLPAMTDPKIQAAMGILMSMVPAAFFYMPALFPIINFKMVGLSCKYGNYRLSPYGYVVYGMILCGVLGQIDQGYEFGRLAFTVMEKYQEAKIRGKVMFVYNSYVRHWKEPLRDCSNELLEAWRACVEQGDIEYGAYSINLSYPNAFMSGRKLPDFMPEYADFVRWIHQSKQQTPIDLIGSWDQALHNLASDEVVKEVRGSLFDVDARVPELLEGQHFKAVAYAGLAAGMTAYIFRDYDNAKRHLDLVENHLDAVMAAYYVPAQRYYLALTLMALAQRGDVVDSRKLVRKARRLQKKIEKWAAHAPMNHAHKVAMLEAENHRLAGRFVDAVTSYGEAMRLAEENGFVNEEALAVERLALLYEDFRMEEEARLHLERARVLYELWGAAAKVKDMSGHRLLAAQLPDAASEARRMETITGRVTTTFMVDEAITTSRADHDLDLGSVMKAARALSGEIELSRLQQRIMQLVIENAGAERGLLLLDTVDGLVVGARGTVDDNDAFLTDDEERLYPRSIIDYVLRTHGPVVLAEATQSELFGQDDYVVDRQPRSVLAAPILETGRLIGIVYLENNVAHDVFTASRLAVLELLSAQAAVSIRNAQLYEEQRRQAESFARFVPTQFLTSLEARDFTDVQVGDHREKEVSILFSDLRKFTTHVERLGGGRVIGMLNRYFSFMERPIHDNDGFIDAYVGDAIMALFDREADTAVHAAIGMQRALQEFNDEAERVGMIRLNMGIGINTGMVMMGIVGGAQRIKCGVVGDCVNLAARIEALSKRYGAALLIGGDTYERLVSPGTFTLRQVDKVAVKGRSQASILYEVLDGETDERREPKEATIALLAGGYEAYYRRDFGEAKKRFQECLARAPGDRLPALFLDRCQRYLDEPPGEDWAGVERLTSKM